MEYVEAVSGCGKDLRVKIFRDETMGVSAEPPHVLQIEGYEEAGELSERDVGSQSHETISPGYAEGNA